MARLVFAHQHHGLTNGRVLFEHGLDLGRFDPQPVQLDLVVVAAEEFQIAVCQPASPIPRAIHSAASFVLYARGPRVADKSLLR